MAASKLKHVFISYKSEEYDQASAVRMLLKMEGIPVWMAPESIESGDNYPTAIGKALDGCGCVLLMMSKASQASRWIQKEIEMAIGLSKTVVPLRLDDSPLNFSFRFMIGDCQAEKPERIDRADPNFKKILASVKKAIGWTDEAKKSAKTAAATTKKPDNTLKAPSESTNFIPKGLDKEVVAGEKVVETATLIEKTLNRLWGSKAFVETVGVDVGPSVIRYRLRMIGAVGSRLIKNAETDLLLALKVASVRLEAPIVGTREIGVELPRACREIVMLSELINSPEFTSFEGELPFVVGKNTFGSPVFFDVAKLPHMLVSGATGQGKSAFLQSLIASLMIKKDPDELRLALVDLKCVEFSAYSNAPHMLVKDPITDPYRAIALLKWLQAEMERRYGVFAEVNIRSYKEYDARFGSDPCKKLPYIVLIIDEFADFTLFSKQTREDFENNLIRLLAKSRAAGIHVILATQRLSADVITGTIKANIPSRIAFKTVSALDSRTILDKIGAESLLGRGDALFNPMSYLCPERVQTAFISDDEINEVLDYAKERYVSVFSPAMEEKLTELVDRARAKNDPDSYPKYDDQLKKAVVYAINSGELFCSTLQRSLSIGYNLAARLLDKMADLGFITPYEHGKPYKTLISIAEYEQFFGENFPGYDEIEEKAKKIGFDMTYMAYLKDATKFAIKEGRVSVAALQRKLKVNYTTASDVLDKMEELEFISKYDPQKPYRILVSVRGYEQFFGEPFES